MNEERINHKVAKRRVLRNIDTLQHKPQTLSSVYEIIFSKPSYTFLNIMNSYSYDEISYGEVDKTNKSYASIFIDLISDDQKYVGLLMDNSKEWIYSFFGLLIAGFVPVLFSTSGSKDEINYVIDRLNIKTVVTNKNVELGENINVINPFNLVITEKDSSLESREFADEIVFLSSGSTGTPKIVFYSGEQICNQLYSAKYVLENTKGIDETYHGVFKHLVVLPFFHVFGLICVLIWFSFLNVIFVLPIDLKPKSIKQACLLAKPTHIFAVPLFWETVAKGVMMKVDTPEKKEKLEKALNLSYRLQKTNGLSGTAFVRNFLFKKYLNMIFGTSIRFCITGGAFIDYNTLRLINLLGYPLVNGYGSTEIGITSLCSSDTIDDRLSLSLGRPFESVQFRIENDNLMVLSNSSSRKYYTQKGELMYLQDDEWICTHDRVELRDDAYFLLGREDEIVVLGNGENISLPSIEKELVIPNAKEFALIKLGEQKIALVVSYSKLVDIKLVKEELAAISNINSSKYISSIIYTNHELPKANEIKYKRFELEKMIKEKLIDYCTLDELNNSENHGEKQIYNDILKDVIDVFSKMFPDLKVNSNSHFYNDLGGDSLRYYMLLAEIEKQFGVEIHIDDLSSAPYTPEQFVLFIGGSKQ